MKAATKKFEISYLRTRNAIERKGIRLIQAALREQYKQFLSRANELPPSMWDNIKISEQPIKQFFEKFYPMSGTLGQMTRKNMLWQKDQNAKKSLEDDLYLSVYERHMQQLVSTSDYAARISTITNTTSDRINTVLQQVMTESEFGGYGIDKIRQTLSDAIGASIRGNVRARAKAIAQTEMISASNQASTYAADSTGLEYRKYWSTSHLQGIRPTHIMAEQDSIQRGGLKKDELFANGLRFPGDPSGSAEEVINCYLSDTIIQSQIVGAQRSFYSGYIIEIITNGGKRLSITPNHRILTKDGFIKACDIKIGDNLICNAEKINIISRINNYINKKKSTAANIFRTLDNMFVVKTRMIIGLDFDGDGKFMDKKINTIDMNRELSFNSHMAAKNVGQFRFKHTRAQASLIASFCSFHFGFNGMFSSSNCIMSIKNLFLSCFGIHKTPFKFFSIGTIPKINASIFKSSHEGNPDYTGFVSELLHTNSAIISFDKVVNVRDYYFSGHVYDFTSLNGVNIANNIYTSNCRCTVLHEII